MHVIINNDGKLVVEVDSTTDMYAIRMWLKSHIPDEEDIITRYAETTAQSSMMETDPYEDCLPFRVMRSSRSGGAM